MSLFITQKGFDFVNHINDELLDSVMQQAIVLYKISLQNTRTNIYGESIIKDYSAGTEINVFIDPEDQETNDSEIGGPDVGQSSVFGFHRDHLSNLSIFPEIGDIIEWNDTYFEINAVRENTLFGGLTDYSVGIVCDTHMTRRTRLQIEERFK